MRVECQIEECNIDPEDGRPNMIPGVCVKCSRCDHEATAFGTGERSIKRALMTLREECPEEEDNYYVAEEAGGESRMPDPVVKPWWHK